MRRRPLIKYKQKHGDCLVPHRWTNNKKPFLGKWVERECKLYKQGFLLKDRQIRLVQIKTLTWKLRSGGSGFDNDTQWNSTYYRLLTFREEHGQCDVPRGYEKDKQLSGWVKMQRSLQVEGIVLEDRKQQLEEIGCTWSFEEQFFKQWRQHYEQLKCFKETNGNLQILCADKKLAHWAYLQRVQFANGRLEVGRKALGDDIGSQW
jgi:hypothetical protein